MDKNIIDGLIMLAKNKKIFGLEEQSFNYNGYEETDGRLIIKSKNGFSITATIRKDDGIFCDIALIVDKKDEEGGYFSSSFFSYEENRFIDSSAFEYIIDIENAYDAIETLTSEYCGHDQDLNIAKMSIEKNFIKIITSVMHNENISINKLIDMINFKVSLRRYDNNKTIRGIASLYDFYHETESAGEYVEEVYDSN